MAAPAGAAIHWRVLSDGISSGNGPPTTIGYVAVTRAAATKQFSGRLTASARSSLARVDFSRDALVAIFGEFGCRDPQIVVSSIAQQGVRLTVRLVDKPLKPGTVACMAIFATYRFVLVAKTELHKPYPTRVTVTLARA
jgi:hypothetical protein